MLKYYIFWEEGNEIAYKYHPEGDEDFGVIIYNKDQNTLRCDKLADVDESKTYAGMLFDKIRQFAETNNFEKEGTIAWY